MHETLDYTIREASVTEITISWQESIGRFLIFLIGNLDFTVKLFVLQTLDFIFLNHVIPAGSWFVRAFFGWECWLLVYRHCFWWANFDLILTDVSKGFLLNSRLSSPQQWLNIIQYNNRLRISKCQLVLRCFAFFVGVLSSLLQLHLDFRWVNLLWKRCPSKA